VLDAQHQPGGPRCLISCSTIELVLASVSNSARYTRRPAADVARSPSDAHESSILAEYFFSSKPARSTRAVLDYTRLLPPLIFRCATVLYATRPHSPPLASGPHCSTTLDSLVLDSPTRVHHWPGVHQTLSAVLTTSPEFSPSHLFFRVFSFVPRCPPQFTTTLQTS
jgi:hypothetical protein